ncbi:MAG TPA: hypothetical protein VFY39_13950 [Gammaproteobacteria bacterium]|nr:hypothetical protein [Gammaproteobacteria bacterium]
MSLLSRQRENCERLALAVQEDRDAMVLSQAELLLRLREKAATPAGLAVCFAAGLLVGRFIYQENPGSDSDNDETGARKRPGRLAAAGSLGLRLFELFTSSL